MQNSCLIFLPFMGIFKTTTLPVSIPNENIAVLECFFFMIKDEKQVTCST